MNAHHEGTATAMTRYAVHKTQDHCAGRSHSTNPATETTLFHHQSSGVRNTTNLTGVRNYPHDGPRQRAYTSRIDEAQASDVVDTTVKG